MRVACYIDGFNLYHAIDDLDKPHLKWLDVCALAKSLCRVGEDLVKVAYFSAYATWLPAKYARHRQYVAAIQHLGAECHMARFTEKTARSFRCNASWKQHEEKETDVHLSLTLVEDAIDNVFDRAIIIGADGDLVPAVRMIRRRLPGKQMFVATPPERHSFARELVSACNSSTNITAGRLARCLMSQTLRDANSKVVARRPLEYDHPLHVY
jgi:uncharacterized LabA/DUF88 family protein